MWHVFSDSITDEVFIMHVELAITLIRHYRNKKHYITLVRSIVKPTQITPCYHNTWNMLKVSVQKLLNNVISTLGFAFTYNT